jgi:hypothetical protein
MQDVGDDDRELAALRQQRMRELLTPPRPRFGTVRLIARDDFIKEARLSPPFRPAPTIQYFHRVLSLRCFVSLL